MFEGGGLLSFVSGGGLSPPPEMRSMAAHSPYYFISSAPRYTATAAAQIPATGYSNLTLTLTQSCLSLPEATDILAKGGMVGGNSFGHSLSLSL